MATSEPDTRRSEAVERFKAANCTLQELLNKGTRQKLRAFPDLADADVLLTSQKLESALASFPVTRNTSATSPSRLDTAKKIAKEWFLASYPFAQVILQIGATGSQV
jgi:hypothetical protein